MYNKVAPVFTGSSWYPPVVRMSIPGFPQILKSIEAGIPSRGHGTAITYLKADELPEIMCHLPVFSESLLDFQLKLEITGHVQETF